MYVELDITQREWKRSRNGHFFPSYSVTTMS